MGLTWQTGGTLRWTLAGCSFRSSTYALLWAETRSHVCCRQVFFRSNERIANVSASYDRLAVGICGVTVVMVAVTVDYLRWLLFASFDTSRNGNTLPTGCFLRLTFPIRVGYLIGHTPYRQRYQTIRESSASLSLASPWSWSCFFRHSVRCNLLVILAYFFDLRIIFVPSMFLFSFAGRYCSFKSYDL